MGATAGLVITAGSTASSYIGQRNAANAAVRQGNYQADIYGLNATVAEQQAADAIARGQQQEGVVRRGGRAVAGHQRAALAAQGLDISSGSASDLLQETAQLSELDALTIRNNAKREAWGFQMEAQSDRMSAELARMGGQNEAAARRSAATSTLLTGGLETWGYARESGEKLRRRGSVKPKSRGGWGGNG